MKSPVRKLLYRLESKKTKPLFIHIISINLNVKVLVTFFIYIMVYKIQLSLPAIECGHMRIVHRATD